MNKNNKDKKKDPPSEDLRDKILNSALLLFAEKGYTLTSLEDIKQDSELSTSKIYRYFKNKPSIAKALYEDLMQRMVESIQEINRTNETAADRMYALVDLVFSLTEIAPDAMNFLLFSRQQEFNNEDENVKESPFMDVIPIIENGIKAGEIRRIDPKLIYSCFLGIILNTIRLRLDGTLEKPLDLCTHDVWSLAWKSIEAT